jgi:hypothetical protein
MNFVMESNRRRVSRPAPEDFAVSKLKCEARTILFLNKKRPGLAVATGLAIPAFLGENTEGVWKSKILKEEYN